MVVGTLSITVILVTIGWAVLFSITAYLKKSRKTLPESFKPVKFISTIIYAAVVGTILAFKGLALTPSNYEAVAMANTVVAIIIQNVVNTVYRQVTIERVAMGKKRAITYDTKVSIETKSSDTEKEVKK